MTGTVEKARLVEAWPVGRRVTVLDAWMRNPVEAKIFRHWNSEHVGAEDDRGLRYYAHVGRLRNLNIQKPDVSDFDDILGESTPKTKGFFDDILG